MSQDQYEKLTNHDEEEQHDILKERAGLDAYTIQFLGAYKYGEELMVKLEKAMQ